MMTTKKICREWRRWVGIPTTALMMCAAMLAGCSHDDGLEPGGDDPVAVSFTATVDGVALPTAKSAGTRSAGHDFTGATPAGVPYRDYTDADGFQTRAFYPGASRHTGHSHDTEIAGSSANTAAVSGKGSANAAQTRTTAGGNEWVQDDPVGIFMLANGGNLTTQTDRLADNVEYAASPESGNANKASFAPANSAETIYYPQSGNVDFIAYYPHGATGTAAGEINNYEYNITVAGQSTDEEAQNALDVLYAKTTNVAKSKTTSVNLEFSHVLSKVTLNVTLGEGLTSLTGDQITAAVFSGMPQTATLDLQDGSLVAGTAVNFDALKAGTASGSAAATFTALVVPQEANAYTGRKVIIAVDGKTYEGTIPDTDAFVEGNHYTYPVTVKLTGIEFGAVTINKWNENDHGTGTAQPLPIETVKIPKGTFRMGSPTSEPNRDGSGDWAETQHSVTLTKDFWMSKYAITNTQYAAFLNNKSIGSNGIGSVDYDNNGSTQNYTDRFISSHSWGVKWETNQWVPQTNYENHPVINVTWYGAKAYADWLTTTTGITCTLPTEAQWEYACRGDYPDKATETNTLPFGIGDGKILTGDMANFNGNYPYNYDNGGHQSGSGTYLQKTSPVGGYLANSYGLYDMHGNVWEWCGDWFGAYGTGPATDPTGPVTGYFRVLRGGSWYNYARRCRSAYRFSAAPDDADLNYGFRVVFVP